MATDRLYIVNKETKEHCCIAKLGDGWQLGNINVLRDFLSSISEGDNLAIGNERNNLFWDDWIKNGINTNKIGKWGYCDSNKLDKTK